VLLDLADTFQAMPDGPRKTALAMELFGRSGAELIPFLNQGRDGIEALQAKMRDLGLEMNTNTAKAAEAFNDALAAVGYAIQGLVNRALIALTPLLESAASGLEWLAENLDAVLGWLKLLAEVGFAVLIYRTIPAAILAFQSLGATAVASAKAASAAWALASSQIAAATAALGPLKIAFLVLGALLIGWEIGKWLSERFAIVRKAGIFMVERLVTGFEHLRYGWELFVALFTSDTLAEATARHRQRLETMRGIFADMYADAERGAGAASSAIDTVGAATQQMAQQLARARQETQASLAGGIEAISATVTAVQAEIQRLDGQIDTARKTVDTALKGIGESYKALTAEVERELAQRLAASEQHYAEQQRQLEAWTGSETAALQRGAELLQEHIAAQVRLREEATGRTLALIESEAQARLEAIRRQGFSDEERARRTAQVEQEVLGAKRQALDAALSDYRRHVDALNREAERHLDEVKRIEDEKRQLSLSTEDRIREIRRAGMSEFEALEDRKRQIAELQTQAREALARGELEAARGFAKQAMDLAAQVASQQTREAQRAEGERARIEQDTTRAAQLEADARAAAARGEHETHKRLLQEADQLRAELAQRTRETDRQIAEGKQGVNTAIEQIRASETLLVKALDDEARAHRTAASEATRARDAIQGTLAATQREIDQIAKQIEAGLTLAVEADISELKRALTEVEALVHDRDWLVFIEADLQAARTQLEEYQALLARGGTLPVDADLSRAQAALERLHGYAQAAARADLQLSTENALAAVQSVERQVQALGRLETESRHRVASNTDTVRAEILRLNSLNTSSTHTIYVRRVEQNAAGGVVGSNIARFADGGAVAGFPSLAAGTVPGAGHQDNVPRSLEAGAFVCAKRPCRSTDAGCAASRVAAQSRERRNARIPRPCVGRRRWRTRSSAGTSRSR
jgi:phage-related minor tail protein